MKHYTNDSIRRQDRLLNESRATELLSQGEYGTLSMVGADGGYGVPLNYVWDGDKSIYFHCAPQGEKLACIRCNPHVSFVVVGHTQVLSKQFTTEYESVLVRGVIEELHADELKMRALELILDKYTPNDKAMGMNYARKALEETAILRLDIQHISGKTKRKAASMK